MCNVVKNYACLCRCVCQHVETVDFQNDLRTIVNLMLGASAQLIQNLNIIFGLHMN